MNVFESIINRAVTDGHISTLNIVDGYTGEVWRKHIEFLDTQGILKPNGYLREYRLA